MTMTRWHEWLERFDQLSLRERALVLAAVLGLLVMLWDAAVAGPQQRARRLKLQQVESLRAEVEGLDRSVASLEARAAGDPARAVAQALAAVQAEIAGLDQRLAGATAGLIEPREMGRVLEDVLAHTAHLKLLSLRTLPPEPLLAATAPPTTPAPAPTATPTGGTVTTGAQLWRHGVEIEIAGSYLETLEFLTALEGLPWRFYWDRIDFAVEQAPRGRARLLVHTLGLQEGWIGV